MSVEVIEIHDSDSDDPGSAAIPATHSTASLGNPFAPPLSKVEIVDVSISLTSPPPAMVRDKKPEPKKKGKGNGKGKLQQLQQIAITRQEKVDHIIHSTSVPTTYDVPRTPTVLLVDLSGSVELLRALDGHIVPLDTFIRAQNHESWDGGAGHTAGNVNVAGFTSNLSEKIRCHRCLLKCNGIDTSDEQGMQELWDSVLDQNEEVAASAPGFICRFYVRIMKTKCKVKCNGVPAIICLRPPYAPPAPLYVNASDMDVQVQVNYSAFNKLSQELPPFPPLPASYPLTMSPMIPVAPKDIDLDLNERNILAGKRKRTKSTRAVTLQLRGPPKNSCAMAPSGVINSKLSTVDTLRQVNGTAIRITLSCVPPVTVTINGLKRVALTPSSPTADGLVSATPGPPVRLGESHSHTPRIYSTTSRAKLEQNLEEFINSGASPEACSHIFLANLFRPDTGLDIYDSLTSAVMSRSGPLSQSSPHELSWTVLTLNRGPPPTRYCNHCNPDLYAWLKPSNSHDPRILKYAGDFIYSLPAPPSRPSSALSFISDAGTVASQDSSFEPVKGKTSVSKEDKASLRQLLIKWREERHFRMGNSPYIPCEVILPPKKLEKLVVAAGTFLTHVLVEPKHIQKAIQWEMAAPTDLAETCTPPGLHNTLVDS
ncbi:hypothetical protein C8J57DRAFT_1718899 [Mycena rebaudengoi]|nr:hypothetical protein C8J57DRAFT_1718899 [Mycena rebaudengoi]